MFKQSLLIPLSADKILTAAGWEDKHELVLLLYTHVGQPKYESGTLL